MKARNSLAIAAITVLGIAGCASGPAPKAVPVSGSKADATVTMSAIYNPSIHDTADWSTANADAVERCKVWGYEGAEPFGSTFEQCSAWTGGMINFCAKMQATRSYQCTGETN